MNDEVPLFGNTRTPIFNQRTAKPFEGYAFPKGSSIYKLL